jgi:hypothetical protein
LEVVYGERIISFHAISMSIVLTDSRY